MAFKTFSGRSRPRVATDVVQPDAAAPGSISGEPGLFGEGGGGALAVFRRRTRIVKTLQEATRSKALTIYTVHDALTKAWARQPAFTAGDLKLQLCGYKDDGIIQPHHGKAYAFSGKNKVVLAMGSANFTSRGLVLSRDQGGNVEVMLRYPPAELAQLPIPLLVDPEASAGAVTSECDLADRAEEKIESEITPFSLRLSEAAVHQDSLELRIDGQELRSEMICQISQAKKPSWDLELGNSEGGVLNAKLTSDQQNRLSSAPAIAQIGTGQATGWNALSNPLLVTNLRNFLTGGDLSRERQFREAQESPQRFLNILTLLGNGENQERLKIFLECFTGAILGARSIAIRGHERCGCNPQNNLPSSWPSWRDWVNPA